MTHACLAERLREERTRCHYTQDALAQQIGVSKTAISHYERGNNLPSLPTLLNIVRVLDLPGVDTLLSQCCALTSRRPRPRP